ncbi:hypothetical protein HPB50_008250 [Hyalomma asiaticum]|uniref:Uncharacterized protein n=1 Tax=Hyalomma asiaticum TaxID=266040 RepID=A0ACB7T6L7_HYAAI|nr:hypothetical protein HPB50_008250 [Hyalomma asiaticum]
MTQHTDTPVRENCFTFNAPEGDVSIDDLIDAVEAAAGEDSVLVLQHMGGSKFLVCTRNAAQATKLMVAEGFKLKHEKVAVEAVGPPVTFVNVYRLPAYLPDEVLVAALQPYGKVRCVNFATLAGRHNKLNGVRIVKIEMSRPVPNFMTIQGHRVMFEYRGMRRVCARCGDDGHMASNCVSPYCKRCGVFGHETEGCSEECKRCGGTHGTRDCFRKKTYASAARGSATTNNEPPLNETQMARTPGSETRTSGLQVLKPRTLPARKETPNYWDLNDTTESR